MPRVLIIKPSSLGDIIHGLQVAQSLRTQWPAVEVDWVAAKMFAPLVRQCAGISRVYEFDRQGSVRAFLDLVGHVRETSYDWALDFQGLARSAVLLAASRARRKARRPDAREGARWLCRRHAAFPPTGENSHALEILLQFLPLLGLEPRLDRSPLVFRPPEVSAFPPGLLASRPVVLFPDSRRAEKEWGGFPALTAKLLEQRPNLPIAWAGRHGPAPDPSWPAGRFWNLVGQTPLVTLPALLASARLVICNDSGPMHLAAALGRPVVALFGPTSPDRFGPYPLSAPKHFVVRAPGGDFSRLDLEAVLPVVMQAVPA